MSDNKKYYWLKLKENFFTQKEIKRLRRLAGGDTYTIIYLKLLLLSLKNEGKIYFDDVGDNFADELSLEIDEEIDNIKMTLSYLQQKGLLELISQDEIYLNEVQSMLGSESESAERVRNHRRKLKQGMLQSNENLLQSNNDVTKGNTEIELEKELDIEIKKDTKIHYDEFVSMTEEEYKKLIEKYEESYIKEKIIDLNLWKGSKGKKTKSDYLTLLTWIRKDNKDIKPKSIEGRANAGAYKKLG